MKLHSDVHTRATIREALDRAIADGKVDQRVQFSELTQKRSNTRANGFEIRLEWMGLKQRGDGRRYTNGGNRGADTASYGAFWEEWGWFIVELYSVDSDLVFGHYKTENGFHEMTRYKFALAD